MSVLLLVEDNEMNADMLLRRLRRRGYEITLARDGQQAVQLAVECNPSLILMDLSLPEMDGYEATRQIRTRQASNVPIIALTAHALADDRDKALAAGCDDYETKPVNFPRLLEKIERYLGGCND